MLAHIACPLAWECSTVILLCFPCCPFCILHNPNQSHCKPIHHCNTMLMCIPARTRLAASTRESTACMTHSTVGSGTGPPSAGWHSSSSWPSQGTASLPPGRSKRSKWRRRSLGHAAPATMRSKRRPVQLPSQQRQCSWAERCAVIARQSS